MPTPKEIRELTDKVTRDLVDRGLLIEAGWISLRAAAIPERATAAQLDDMRMAFFAGAQHLFGSINSIMDPGDDAEPTDADLNRMSQINDELQRFVVEMKELLKRRASTAPVAPSSSRSR